LDSVVSPPPFGLSLSKPSFSSSCFGGTKIGKASTGSARTVLGVTLSLILSLPTQAAAQSQSRVTSTQTTDVSVTIYRDPNRGGGEVNKDWPGGYAFITETRTITIPAGRSTIRFEGVAEGMLPETAIVTGLPKGVREKNRDARLISPAGLVDAYLKRSVHLRRTNRATGKVTEQDAIIQAGPNGGVILKTSEGYEALGCSGLPERMLYDGVPADLSARPTLSVEADSDTAVTATVQLSYLAQGFDWAANYIAQMDGAKREMGLFAWLTVVNGGAQSFTNAKLQVVAGQPNKQANAEQPSPPPVALYLACWPMDTTSTHPGQMPPPPPPPQPAPEMMGDIVVTAMRQERSMMESASPVTVMKAEQEDLGDLKLYRVPERVTVAAQAQKQVAMINQPKVQVEQLYRLAVDGMTTEPRSMPILVRTKNSKDKGLGLPLPSGRVALFEPFGGERLLAGEDDLEDRAVNDDVELTLGLSPDVQVKRVDPPRKGASRSLTPRFTLSNAKTVAVTVELTFPYNFATKPKDMKPGKGGWIWRGTVPANESRVVDFNLTLSEKQGGRGRR
jgi:hypothetical protein